KFSLVM
ncbi:Branched-chain amino acid transport system 2 carrier protein, partial [Haemophilus influenzae]